MDQNDTKLIQFPSNSSSLNSGFRPRVPGTSGASLKRGAKKRMARQEAGAPGKTTPGVTCWRNLRLPTPESGPLSRHGRNDVPETGRSTVESR